MYVAMPVQMLRSVDLLRRGNGLLAEAAHAALETVAQPLASGVAA